MSKKLALISDVHADLHALSDALRIIEQLGCDATVCAGDLVDFGAQMEETLALLRERAIPCIRGNHDRWLLAEPTKRRPPGAQRRLRALASSDAVRFLEALPTAWDAVIEGVRVAVRHGTPGSDMDGVYPDQCTPDDVRRWLEQARADVLVVGHTHRAFELRAPGVGLIVNPGALLRDFGEPGAAERYPYVATPGTFGVLELPSKQFTAYDSRTGLPLSAPIIVAGTLDRR